MGIKSFSRFLDENTPSAIRKINLQHLYGKIVAVDVSIYMHKFSYQKGSTVTDSINKFLYMNSRFVSNNIKPIYVFDGEPPAEKSHVLVKRAKRRERLNHMNKNKYVVTRSHYIKLKQEFCNKGIDYICAANDAEKTCAWLCRCNIADAVFTDDYDTLAFGAPIMIRNGNKRIMDLIDRKEILKKSDFTESEFTNFCVLCGSEYTPTHFRYGYKKALLSVKELNQNVELNNVSKKFTVYPHMPTILSVNSKYVIIHIICKIINSLVLDQIGNDNMQKNAPIWHAE